MLLSDTFTHFSFTHSHIVTMNDKIKERLTSLKNDFENGQLQLIKLQDKQEELEQQLYRLAGAIQVLEDLLQESRKVAEV